MAFVYRYLNPDSDEVVYIGKTSGDSIESLRSRIAAHAAEDKFKKGAPCSGWRIEYVDGLTPADADILETALINSCKPSVLFNKSKTGWGNSSMVNLSNLEWRQWERSRRSPDSLPIVWQPGKPATFVSVEEYAAMSSITVQAAYKQIRHGKLNTFLFKDGKRAKRYIEISASENAPFENHRPADSSSNSVISSLELVIDALSKQLRVKDEQINRLTEEINRLLAEVSKNLGAEVAP